MCKFKIKRCKLRWNRVEPFKKHAGGQNHTFPISTWTENVNSSLIYEDKKRSKEKQKKNTANKSKNTLHQPHQRDKSERKKIWSSVKLKHLRIRVRNWKNRFKTSGKYHKFASKSPKIILKLRFLTCFRSLSRSGHVNTIFKFQPKQTEVIKVFVN